MDETTTRYVKGIAAGLVALLVVTGLLLYATDYGVEATITDKGSDGDGNYIIATTDVGGIDVKRYLALHEWGAVKEGNFVVYHLQSGTIEVYSSEGGTLIWKG